MRDRTDAFGRAYAGSQRQIQTHVNRRRADFDAAIPCGLPVLAVEGVQLEWVSPREEECFKEYQDGAFLGALGLLDLSGVLAEFWPHGGPVWDALVRVTLPGSDRAGVLARKLISFR